MELAMVMVMVMVAYIDMLLNVFGHSEWCKIECSSLREHESMFVEKCVSSV